MKIKSMLAAGALALATVAAAAPLATAAEADDTPGIADTAALADFTDLDHLPLAHNETWGAEESPGVLSDLAHFTDSLNDTAHQALETGR
ncbi:hypothetical protein [Streptomyces sp. NPDC088762]|uniref:hypothetical protein n=1 Tax=Streptomyces sp. NPDC088762 TaxID=3365891 RepID=UPI003819719C